MKPAKNGLRLSRETLRRLSPQQLRGVVGGTDQPDPKDPGQIAQLTDTCPTNQTQFCPAPDSLYQECHF
jgi:hypothetical protein